MTDEMSDFTVEDISHERALMRGRPGGYMIERADEKIDVLLSRIDHLTRQLGERDERIKLLERDRDLAEFRLDEACNSIEDRDAEIERLKEQLELREATIRLKGAELRDRDRQIEKLKATERDKLAKMAIEENGEDSS